MFERCQILAAGRDAGQGGIRGEAHAVSAAAVEVRYDETVGGADRIPETVLARMWCDEGLEGAEAVFEPMRGPLIFLCLIRPKLFFEFLQDVEIMERLNAAVDDFTGLNDECPLIGVGGEEARHRFELIEIFDDGHGLPDRASLMNEGRDLMAGIELTIRFLMLFATLVEEMDGFVFIGDAFEVQGDPDPVRG